jgi:cob(I)alamin adenosyltransferase
MEAIGAVDEANSAIGLAVCTVTGGIGMHYYGCRTTCSIWARIWPRRGRFRALAHGAAHGGGADGLAGARHGCVERGLAPLTSFILPGGTEGAARVHIARAAARGPNAPWWR